MAPLALLVRHSLQGNGSWLVSHDEVPSAAFSEVHSGRGIEITPEMIEAGKRVVMGAHLDFLEPADLAELIYEAMRPLPFAHRCRNPQQ